MKNAVRVAVMAAIGISTIAYAAKPADVISARQGFYKQIGKSTKALFDEQRASTPSLDTIRQNAAIIAKLAPQVPRWFPKGTGPEAGVKTDALPAIWEKPAEFRKAAADFATAANGLSIAAKGTDMAAITAATRALGGACKGCHDQFKVKK